MRYSSQLLIRVQPSLADRLASAAKMHGIGKSELTRRAIERELVAIHDGKSSSGQLGARS